MDAAAVERQQRLALMVAEKMITDASRVQLFPLTIGGTKGHYTVSRLATGTAITTSEQGVEAIRLLTRGLTLEATKRALGEKYDCDPSTVDISQLLESLAYADFVRSIDGHRIATTTRTPIVRALRIWVATRIEAKLLVWLVRCCPLRLALPLLYTKHHRRDVRLLARIATNLQAAPALGLAPNEAHTTAAQNYDNLRRAQVDHLLLYVLKPSKLQTWLKTYVRVSGLEHLERARTSGAGTILCGIHAGSYNLLPFILSSRGYQLTVLAKLLEHAEEVVARRIEEICQAGYQHDVTVVRGPMAIRTLVRSLRRQGMALVLCDTHGEAADQTMAVNFLGRSLQATQGVGWLQQRTGAAVLPVVLEWEGRTTHHLTIMPPIVVDADSAPDRIKAVATAVLGTAERRVQADPAQWLKWKDFHEMVV